MTRTVRGAVVLGAAAAFLGFKWESSVVLAQSENVLIIVADDLGIDVLESYGEGASFPPTPTLDKLRNAGVLFRNAWSNPLCSTTRATLQTGRYSFRTGVGTVVRANDDEGLPFSETIIPEVLDLNPSLGYSHSAIGKWHLTSDSQGEFDGPNLSGYAHFSGTMWNLADYYDWPKTENGETADTDVYATTDNVNEAIEWINDQGDTPWFMWLAFNAPHHPFHAPPDDLHSYDLPNDPSDALLYQAMVEAMDSEIGRLLDSIPKGTFQRTNIIFLGDNGTPGEATQRPFDPQHAKGTLYQGGINVPLIISGPQVIFPGRESNVLVNTTDLFATALEMMGVDVEASLPRGTVLDSRSVLPLLRGKEFKSRLNVYAEAFNNSEPTERHGQTIRNESFKLIRFTTHPEEFYDLVLDPLEETDLLLDQLNPFQQTNYDALALELDSLTGGVCEGDANGDGSVNPLDSGFVLARLGCQVGVGNPDCDASDVNGDGEVDPLDNGFILARYGECQ